MSIPPQSADPFAPALPRGAPARRSGLRPRMQWGPADVVGAVAAGGVLGALARHGAATAVPTAPGGVPWATLAVNVLGSALIGVLLVLVTEVAGRPHRLARPFLGTGVLGGFTTFSSVSVETERLLVTGAAPLGLAYLFGTLVAALGAAWAGVLATRAAAARFGPGREGAR